MGQNLKWWHDESKRARNSWHQGGVKRIPENATLALCSTQFFKGVNDDGDEIKCGYKFLKFVVMGHRGSGMNKLESSDPRIKTM